ncbi:MAG: ferredoxin family protein [Proteobacteria bacterium]|nr:ferredoxin family protein [Pseudomonadota bacterium]
MWEVVVDSNKCTGAQQCVDNCPTGVYETKDGKAVPTHADECIGCRTCMEVGPTGACQVTEID